MKKIKRFFSLSSYYKLVEPFRETFLRDKENGHEIIIVNYTYKNGDKEVETIDHQVLEEDFRFNDFFFEASDANEWQLQIKMYKRWVKYQKTCVA